MNLLIEHIVDLMMKIERLGDEMYRRLMEQAQTEELKSLFFDLAGQEQEHYRIYEKLREGLLAEGLPKLDEERETYLNQLIKDTLLVLDSGRTITTMEEGIKHALRMEKETILMLYELKALVREEHYPVLDKIIEEEQKHFLWIMERA